MPSTLTIEQRLDKCIEAVVATNFKVSALIDRISGGPEVLVSCTEAARLLGVSNHTISVMIRDHRLHKTTIGISTGIRLSEIRKITNPQ